MQSVAALSAAALLAITAPLQEGLEAYKAGKFSDAATALDLAASKAGTNQVELAESARIWSAAARARGDEKTRIQGVKDLRLAYAAATDTARRALAFELWKDAAMDSKDLEPSMSPEETLRTMQQLATFGQIGRAESMLGPPLSNILALWRRLSEETDSPLEMLEDLPMLTITAGTIQWPEGRVVATANIEMVTVDVELSIRPDGWAVSRVCGVRSPEMMMGMQAAGVMIDVEPNETGEIDVAATDKAAAQNKDAEQAANKPVSPEIQTWINELSSPDAGTRARARESLKNAGPAAYPALREALNHADPEVSETARGLLP